MARVGTPNHNLGMWLDGENPGAGAQDADSLGLNGNWWKLDRITSKLTEDGSLAAGAVLPTNLDATVVDGVTLLQDAGTKKLQVKGLGIGTAQLALGSVDATILGASAVTEVKIANANVTEVKIADGAVAAAKIGASAVTTVKINAGAVTPAKIAHDTTARKQFIYAGFAAAETYGIIGGVVTTDAMGVKMGQGFRVTGIQINDNLGNSNGYTQVWASAVAFLATDRLAMREHSGVFTVKKNGVDTAALVAFAMGSTALATIEIELED